jgi:predicted RNA-binding Zn-ribbon protein involved in translation (DUF1610 family)
VSFGVAKQTVARKQHKCGYCGFHIEKGETYSRQKGVYDGAWYDQIYCLRCVKVMGWLYRIESVDYEEMRGLYEDFLDFGYLRCPDCGGSIGGLDLKSREKDLVLYECRRCGAKGKIDISLEAIKQKLEAN